MNKISKIIVLLLFAGISSFAQNNVIPNGWHMMDKEADGISGASV